MSHRKNSGDTVRKVSGYIKSTLSRVEKLLSEFSDMPLSRGTVEKIMQGATKRTELLQKYRGQLRKFDISPESQSLLIRMTTACRQMKLLQELTTAFKTYYRDGSGSARDVLLSKISSIKTSFKSVIATVRSSVAMGLEAAPWKTVGAFWKRVSSRIRAMCHARSASVLRCLWRAGLGGRACGRCSTCSRSRLSSGRAFLPCTRRWTQVP